MKKYTLIAVLLFTFCAVGLGQNVPTDSLLLKTIFGSVDIDKKTFTKNYENEENKINLDDSLKYYIAFKDFLAVEGEPTLVVICKATSFYQHGHKFGYTDFYYLRKLKGEWKVMYSKKTLEEEANPIGDEDQYAIVKIGKDKHALVSTFSSTGNNHFERSIGFTYLTMKGPMNIGYIDMEYSNVAWTSMEETPENEACPSNSYACEYKIIESEKEWYDILVTKITTTYSNGCKNEINAIQEFTLANNGNGYKGIK